MSEIERPSGQALQFSTFTVGGLYCGIDVLKVQEVMRYHAMTKVPLAPAVVEGLINLRGEIVTALDLRKRMGLPPRAEGARPMNVVVRTETGVVSLFVDEIGDVVDVKEEDFEKPPETVSSADGCLILGVYKMKGRLLHVLDTEKAVLVPADDGGIE